MKMKFGHRLLLALYALLGLCAVAVVALRLFMPEMFERFTGEAARLFERLRFLPYLLLAVLAIWSVGMFLLAFRRDRRKKDRSNVSIQNTEDGAVLVSVEAIETLVKEAIGQSDEVLEVKSRVINHEDSITVTVRMVMSTNAHIPNITMLMQRNIKRYIEEYSGIAVREVIITVTEVREPAEAKKALKAGKAAKAKSIEAPAVRPAQKEESALAPIQAVPVEAPVQEEKLEPVVVVPAEEPLAPVPEQPQAVAPEAVEPLAVAEEPTDDPVPEVPAEKPVPAGAEIPPAPEAVVPEEAPVAAEEAPVEAEEAPRAPEPQVEAPSEDSEAPAPLEAEVPADEPEMPVVPQPAAHKITLFLDPNDDPEYKPDQPIVLPRESEEEPVESQESTIQTDEL